MQWIDAKQSICGPLPVPSYGILEDRIYLTNNQDVSMITGLKLGALFGGDNRVVIPPPHTESEHVF